MPATLHPLPAALVFIFLLLLACDIAGAQQPFVTDDADVTPKRHWHFEFSNRFDLLQRSAFPNIKQNTLDFELDFGLFENVEIGVAAPVLILINDRQSPFRRSSGLGDMSLSLKYNFLSERERSRKPALAVAVNVGLPTGDINRQLGSGLWDLYLNGILQKSINKKTTLRLNGGILFSGNQSTGAIGIKTRGTVFTVGGSLVREFTSKLNLGIELTGAETTDFELAKGQLQVLIGGNYQVHRNTTFDFGVVAGKYIASPRAGVQVGLSVDW